MAIETACQTPGARYDTRITPDRLEIVVDFGRRIDLDEKSAAALEGNAHNALELVLALHWPQADARNDPGMGEPRS